MRLVRGVVPRVGHVTFVSSSHCVDGVTYSSMRGTITGFFPSRRLRRLSAAFLSARVLLSALHDCSHAANLVCCS